MITGLVEAAGQVRGQPLLVTPAGVFIELAAGDGNVGTALWQRLWASGEVWVICDIEEYVRYTQ